MVIELNLPWQDEPRLWINDPGRLGEAGEIVTHELMHIWQVLSQPYQFMHAEVEWQALRHHIVARQDLEQSADKDDADLRSALDTVRKIRRADTRIEDFSRISNQEIYEGLARYWEIVIVGADRVYERLTGAPLPPHVMSRRLARRADTKRRDPYAYASMEAVDFVMMASNEPYKWPYLLVRHNFPRFGAYLFPLIAHAALQTSRPARVFERLASSLQAALTLGFWKIDKRKFRSATALTREMWPSIRESSLLIAEKEDAILPDIATSLQNSPICTENSVFAYYAGLYEFALQSTPPGTLEFSFVIPGFSREFLFECFKPPLFKWMNGNWCGGTDRQLEFSAILAESFAIDPGSQRAAALRASFIRAPRSHESERLRSGNSPTLCDIIATEAWAYRHRWDVMQYERLVADKIRTLNGCPPPA